MAEVIIPLLVGIASSALTFIIFKMFKPSFEVSDSIIVEQEGDETVYKLKIVNTCRSKIFNLNYMLYIVKSKSETVAEKGKTTPAHFVTYDEIEFRYEKLTMLSEKTSKNNYYLNACILSFSMDKQTEERKELFNKLLRGDKDIWLEFSIYGERPWFETSKFVSKIYGNDAIKRGKRFVIGNKCSVLDK